MCTRPAGSVHDQVPELSHRPHLTVINLGRLKERVITILNRRGISGDLFDEWRDQQGVGGVGVYDADCSAFGALAAYDVG